MNNIFASIANIPNKKETEVFEKLLEQDNLVIERIVSAGQTTPEGEWYDQTTNEWVILLQGEAELTYENGETQRFSKGDYVLIPKHKKHRVTYTSEIPICIWIAVHFE